MFAFPASYVRSHTRTLVLLWVVGLAALALLMLAPAPNRALLLALTLMFGLLCSPFTLRTATGRLWWAAYAAAIFCGAGAVVLGGPNPLGWLLAACAAGGYSLGVCLRWRPPPR